MPSLSVAVGMFLGLLSTFTLVYFIHHVIVSMEAETVIARIGEDLHDTIDVLFPEGLGKDETQASPENQGLPADFEDRSSSVYCEHEGFIGSIDNDKLLKLAVKHDLIVKTVHQPGDFVFENLLLAKAWPEGRATELVCSKIRKSFHVSRQRTYEQDLRLALYQLVLLATRSLSPSINALGTAMDSIDRIGAALILIGNRRIPSAKRYDESQKLRILTPPWNFEQLAGSIVRPLCDAAESNPTVINHLRTVFGTAIDRNPPQSAAQIRTEKKGDKHDVHHSPFVRKTGERSVCPGSPRTQMLLIRQAELGEACPKKSCVAGEGGRIEPCEEEALCKLRSFPL